MEQYPSNSRSATKEANDVPDGPKIQRVVTSGIEERKTPLGKRIKNMLVGGDARGVWGYVMASVLIPAAQDMLTDAVKEGVERMVYGETTSRPNRNAPRSSGQGNSFVSYNKFGGNQASASRPDPREQRGRRTSTDLGENVIGNRAEAEAVLDQMFAVLQRYQQVSVSDYYEMIGKTGLTTDDKWGWYNLDGSGINRARGGGGYIIDLPRPEPLT